jgi:SPP1 gp7 family putative phage head morphogenesis protein
MKYTDSQITAMIKGIENGTITLDKLPVDYYMALTDYFSKGIFKGFGSTLESASTLDLPLLKELITNTYTFGAAKTFQQTKEISILLVNRDTGEVRTSREFNSLARQTYDNWNNNWGVTEYNTAIGQADMANKWNTIENQKDIMPYLRYSAIGDACVICRPLDGIIARVEDPIWNRIYPTNHFNCFCVVLQEDVMNVIQDHGFIDDITDRMNPMFINNVGKTGQVFTKDHPYYEVAKEYKEYAKANFNLPIPNLTNG